MTGRMQPATEDLPLGRLDSRRRRSIGVSLLAPTIGVALYLFIALHLGIPARTLHRLLRGARAQRVGQWTRPARGVARVGSPWAGVREMSPERECDVVFLGVICDRAVGSFTNGWRAR